MVRATRYAQAAKEDLAGRGRYGATQEAYWALQLAHARGHPLAELGAEDVWAAWQSGELDQVRPFPALTPGLSSMDFTNVMRYLMM